MKIALVIAMLGSVAAGSAAAAEGATDLDYIRANRCKGLAVGTGLTDTKGLDGYLKEAKRGRAPFALAHADQEFDKAKKDARRNSGKVAAELGGACAVYMGGSQATAAQATPAS